MTGHTSITTVPAHLRIVRDGRTQFVALEMTIPGWSGMEHAEPPILVEIRSVLDKSDIAYCNPYRPEQEGVMVLREDGLIDFVLRDPADLEAAVTALTQAGLVTT